MGKQPIGVSNIINDICRELQPLIIKTKAKITFDKDLPTIVAYPTELRMLFQNLLSNSLKFIKKNRAPKIDIQYNEDSYYHIFHIKDNGIGIDDNKHDKIFNLFARLNSVDDFEGIGIGLTHCKKIAELHEGSIHVKKNTKQGAVFSVYINKTL
jgi:light-regulated signal transduction histidine kinase (bacteriophytochrome)